MIALFVDNVKYYVNPANVLYLRQNSGGRTFVAFNSDEGGRIHSIIVDGPVDEVAKQFVTSAKQRSAQADAKDKHDHDL